MRQHKKALPEIVEITSKDKVIKELIATEAQYVDDLSVIIQVGLIGFVGNLFLIYNIQIFMDKVKKSKLLLGEGTFSGSTMSLIIIFK